MNTLSRFSAAAPVRCVIVDDERLMRAQLKARLSEVWPELQIVGEASNGPEAVTLVARHRPDVVFMDVRMPGMSGVVAAQRIARLSDMNAAEGDESAWEEWAPPEIVFVTAYDQHAMEAFELGAADYVLKPTERDRLGVTVSRVQRRLVRRRTGDERRMPPLQKPLRNTPVKPQPAVVPPRLKWIETTIGHATQRILVAEVLFFIADKKYTRVQTRTLEALIRMPIRELVDQLDPDVFWRIHRSTLVNTHCISSIARAVHGGRIISITGSEERLKVSRPYVHLFKGM